MNTSINGQMFDLSYLNQVFQGNQEMINNIIQLFLEQVPQYIEEMVECVNQNDLISLHPLAHKAKSSIAMLGLKSIEQQIHQIEEDSKKNQNFEQLPGLVSDVNFKCDLIYEQLRGVLLGSSRA